MADSDQGKLPATAGGYTTDVVREVETKWRERWLSEKTFRTEDPKPGDDTFFCLDMFPYPSGDGLHVGHPVGFIASDVVSRFKRMKGFNVLHPMGWDAFGLPAERHAMKTGQHPSETVRKNAANYRRQMQLIGLSYDWDREVSTTDPEFYKITQQMFLDLYEAWFDPETQSAKHIDALPIPDDVAQQGDAAIRAFRDDHRLAYYDEAMVNFCPELGTVVANEEVMADGRTEQGYEVVRRMQRQVMMRISCFAERLISGLEKLDWPQAIKEMQRNWIGRSTGHKITFQTESGADITVFTTRADTLPGTTFLVLAPEHPLVAELTTDAQRAEVDAYVHAALQKSDLMRKQGAEKTGAALGAFAHNPLTGERVPIFVSDYVLFDTGTGAVMGVPAHDARDFDFAKLYDLPVIAIHAPDGENHEEVAAGRMVWTGDGTSLSFDLDCYRDLELAGLPTSEFMTKFCDYLVDAGLAEISIQYRIRDWIFSRQRYWGEPIPLIHWEDGTVEPMDRAQLPVIIPTLDDYRPSPDGQPPLARATDWVKVTDPATGRTGERETLTMPQWAGSCWYPLRFMDPRNAERAAAPDIEKAWGPVDLYIGGAEHATLHLLYARFWYMALADLGRIDTVEPFQKLVNQGLLQAFTFQNDRGVKIPADEVEERADGQTYVLPTSAHYDAETADTPLVRVKAKMSKTLRNVVTPDQVVEEHGADAFRVCMMFMGPVEQTREWENSKAASSAKFLRRFWRFTTDEKQSGLRDTVAVDQEDADIRRVVDETIVTIEEGIDSLRLNTSIAAFMKCLNEIGTRPVSKTTVERLILILSPFAPFMCEELWSRCGHDASLARVEWPEVDMSQHAGPESVTLVVTINGKKRAQLDVLPDASDDNLRGQAVEAVAERWDVTENNSRILIIRDKSSGAPKLVNIIKQG